MNPHPTPLRTRADLERALAEARSLLPRLDHAGPDETARFQALLQRIAAYRGADPPAQQSPERQRLEALDGQLKAYGRRWSRDDDAHTRHWSSLLGGDMSPRRKPD